MNGRTARKLSDQVFEAVIATSNGKVTAAAIQAVVKERRPKSIAPAKAEDHPAPTVLAPASMEGE